MVNETVIHQEYRTTEKESVGDSNGRQWTSPHASSRHPSGSPFVSHSHPHSGLTMPQVLSAPARRGEAVLALTDLSWWFELGELSDEVE